MPTISSRALGVMLSGAALAGWLAGSTLNPPVATTQVGPPRPTPVPVVHAALPHVSWPAAPRRVAPPVPSRNPFTFRAATRSSNANAATADRPTAPEPSAGQSDAETTAASAVTAFAWRLSGVATSDSGDSVAVLSGGGDVLLLRAGDELPGGDGIVEVGPAHVVVRTTAGPVTLRLP
jgi:hypothetical protein